MKFRFGFLVLLSAFALPTSGRVAAQGPSGVAVMPPAAKPNPASTVNPAVSDDPRPATPSSELPNDYVIGPEDVLTIVFWQDTELTRDVVVRPDGHISLPLLNDIRAAGLTPEQLRDKLATDAARYVEDATVTVIVKEVKSPKVFITGEVVKPGLYPLNRPTTVLQLIATAGGLQEYARSDQINVVRTEGGRTTFLPFNYKAIMRKKNLQQNVALKAGDTVVVP
jgi:polysaccharide export outer membrane protein